MLGAYGTAFKFFLLYDPTITLLDIYAKKLKNLYMDVSLFIIDNMEATKISLEVPVLLITEKQADVRCLGKAHSNHMRAWKRQSAETVKIK